jgi:hypothetical protein
VVFFLLSNHCHVLLLFHLSSAWYTFSEEHGGFIFVFDMGSSKLFLPVEPTEVKATLVDSYNDACVLCQPG